MELISSSCWKCPWYNQVSLLFILNEKIFPIAIYHTTINQQTNDSSIVFYVDDSSFEALKWLGMTEVKINCCDYLCFYHLFVSGRFLHAVPQMETVTTIDFILTASDNHISGTSIHFIRSRGWKNDNYDKHCSEYWPLKEK